MNDLRTLVKMNFNPRIALDIGTDEAIVLENIAFWINTNRANQIDRDNKPSFQDGRWWTYNSVRAFSIQFTWLNEQKIKRILQKLEEMDYVKTGCYNEIKYDKTKWYALGDNILLEPYNTISQNRPIEGSLSTNRTITNDQSIPDYNTNYNTNTIDTIGQNQTKPNTKVVEDTSSQEVSDLFNKKSPSTRYSTYKPYAKKEEKPRYKFHKRPSAIFVEKDY